MTVAEIADSVRQYVLSSFLAETPAESFRDTDDLFRLLDSLQVLRLVLQLESQFGVQVADHELAAENLGSVQRVAEFVVHKGGACPESDLGAPADGVAAPRPIRTT
jgi:acyl carrier protein